MDIVKFSNKQELFCILLRKEKNICDIQFLIDNLVLYNQNYDELFNGKVYHPNFNKYPINLRIKKFYQNIMEKALLCKTRGEFALTYPNEYDRACKKFKCLDEFCSHMVSRNWTKEKVHKLALTCSTRIEFINKYPNAYSSIIKNLKCMDEICSHMIDTNKINQLNYDRIIYAWEFPDKSVYIGLTKNHKQRNKHRNSNLKDTVTMYKNKTGLIPIFKKLTEFLPVSIAQEKEEEFLLKYKNEGWNILNKKKTGAIGGYKFNNFEKL